MREEIADKMAKCIDKYDEKYDEIVDEWQAYFDRFCRRVEELSHNAKKSSVRAISVLTEVYGKGINGKRN